MTRWTTALLLMASGCGQDSLDAIPHVPQAVYPDIYADPSAHAFRNVVIDDVVTQLFAVGNSGDDMLTVDSVALVGEDAASFTLDHDGVTGTIIPAGGGEATLTLSFSPADLSTYHASVELRSNDPDEDPLLIDLHGIGVVEGAGPVAVCDVNPPSVLAGMESTTWAGSGSYDPDGYALVNYGWRLAEKPVGSNAGMPACTDQADCGPFVPDVPGNYVAELAIMNEFGFTSTCSVALEAVDGGDGPVAVCDVSPRTVSPPFESATFIGNGSYDPDGFAITSYSWTLTQLPAGSAVIMSGCSTANCGPITPDVAGTYTGQLIIENEHGKSSSCTVDLEAIPSEELWVEMYWVHSGDDMDLHMVAPGGSARSGQDCYFANCTGIFSNVDWGQSGVTSDNPSLDLDDISGTGPENINISNPAAGVYKVFVHDYPGSTYLGGNDVTVTVYVDGNPVFTDTRTISGEDSDEYFCEINWPAGTVTPL